MPEGGFVSTLPRMNRDRALLACGVVGPLIFVITFLVEGAFRAGYSPLRHPVSSLSLGPYGWLQAANFIVSGLLVLAFAIGLWPAVRRFGAGFWTPVLVGLVGLGLLGAGFFATDPISGYPPGTAPMLAARTVHGVLHDLCSTPVFTALPAACFVVAYRLRKAGQRHWAIGSLVAGIAMLACFILTSLGFQQNPAFVAIGGLFQRLTLIIGFGWLVAFALYLLRDSGGSAQNGG
jgi:hypothetical membrane protein